MRFNYSVLLLSLCLVGCGHLGLSPKNASSAPADWHVQPLAQDYVTIFRSPAPATVYIGSPGITQCPDGRLVATMDQFGSGVGDGKTVPSNVMGRIYTSDDHGKTWAFRGNFPFEHARPFVAGKRLYVLGHHGDLMVQASDDWGNTWSEAVKLTDGEKWHQAPCNVVYDKGNVYLVMEVHMAERVKGWDIAEVAPVLMRAKVTDDLRKRESWTFASRLPFFEAVPDRKLDLFGVPFFDAFYPKGFPFKGTGKKMSTVSPSGWLETNVVQIKDSTHYWFDPEQKTFHLFMRAHTGITNLAAMCKVVEQPDGSMKTELETAPSGKKMVYVQMPGGHMKFHILYDEKTRLYWLLSSQSTDGLTRLDKLAPGRMAPANQERNRLQLHFSKNCYDWCFAGLVAVGDEQKESRHYASMVIDGDDLHVISRSGDQNAHSPHNVNLLSFHTIKNFRRLAYVQGNPTVDDPAPVK